MVLMLALLQAGETEHFLLDNVSFNGTLDKRSVETTAAIHYIEKFVE